jgi:hypothetical protein
MAPNETRGRFVSRTQLSSSAAMASMRESFAEGSVSVAPTPKGTPNSTPRETTPPPTVCRLESASERPAGVRSAKPAEYSRQSHDRSPELRLAGL